MIPFPDRFSTVETPTPNMSSPSVPPSDIASPAAIQPSTYFAPVSTQNNLEQSYNAHVTPSSTHATAPQTMGAVYPGSDRTSSALTTTSPPPHSPDPNSILQSTFTEVLNTPGQLQRLLAALGSAQSQPTYPISDPQPPPQPDPNSQLMAVGPHSPYDFGHGFTSDVEHAPLLSSTADDTSMAHIDPLADNADRIHGNYQDTAEIEKDVNALHTSINSLIESLGLDPNILSSGPTHDPGAGVGVEDPGMNLSSAIDDTGIGSQDIDFDSLWSQFAPDGNEHTDYQEFTDRLNNDPTATAADVSQLPPTAFLDEINSPSEGTASPTTTFHHTSPEVTRPTTTTKSKKRKSDTAGMNELGDHTKSTKTGSTTNSPGSRGKRKR
jgi:hypothetical protein